MVLTFSSFENLLENLNMLSGVVDDPMSGEALRNVIFQFKSDSNTIKMLGCNLNVIFNKNMLEGYTTVQVKEEDLNQDGIGYCQVKCKELLNFLNTYKSTRKTFVESVTLERIRVGVIRCTVVEMPISEKASDDADVLLAMGESSSNESSDKRPNISYWIFDEVNMTASVLEKISVSPVESEGATLSCASMLWHTSLLLPIMQTGTNLFSSAVFDDESVVAFASAFTVFNTNMVADGGIFSGIVLHQRVLAFINKWFSGCSGEDTFEARRSDEHIYIRYNDSEAFFVYSTKLVNYTVYRDMFKKDHVITVDRLYLKDILKRLSLMNDSIEFSINPDKNVVSLRNSKYNQDLDLSYQRGMDVLGSVQFKLLPDVISKAIIGVDETMVNAVNDGKNKDVYIYYCTGLKNSAVIFADGTGSWFSVLSVKKN